MSRADQTPDAWLDPWLLCEVHGGDHILFGYATQHPVTDGLSWMHSSPVKDLDEKTGRARTASGRLYALGRRIAVGELDEEGRAAIELLILKPGGYLVPDPIEDFFTREWLAARKWSRHLKVPPPSRDDPAAVRRFLRTNADRYMSLRNGRI